MARILRILVLADTHNKLPKKILDLAADADEIWHLGDVCEPTILDDLRAIGPRVTVVRGDCDWNSEWPQFVELKRGGLKSQLQDSPPDVPTGEVAIVLDGHPDLPRKNKVCGEFISDTRYVTGQN